MEQAKYISDTLTESATKRTEAESEISIEQWRSLLHTAIVGNGVFPQSFFAQGVRLAEGVVHLSREENISIHSLLNQDPPKELIDSMFGAAKIKAHTAYGFESRGSGVTTNPLRNVWSNDKSHGITVLTNFAKLIYSERHGIEPLTIPDEEVIQDVYSNPEDIEVLQGLLVNASQSLSSDAVREISETYKQKISKFMKKYATYSWFNIPRGYQKNRERLHKDLTSLLRKAATITKDDLAVYLQTEHPQEHKRLLTTMQTTYVEKLFGDINVAGIHPLRNPDYE